MTAPTMIVPRTIALVGLMGSGKSSIGRRLAALLGLPFRDADLEIAEAAGCSIPEIFAEMGETGFRDGERRVIARLLEEPPHILATGGGAFINDQTRALLKARAASVWLRAELPILAKRVARKDGRPLLRGRDPMVVLKEQAAARYPYYAQADIVIDTPDGPHQQTMQVVFDQLKAAGAIRPGEIDPVETE